MSEAAIPKVQGSSAGGLAGALKGVPDGTFSVAPTVATDRNQLTTGLIPIACWRVDDIRFDFDSSFVLPDLADEMVLLGQLRTEHSLLIPGSEPPDSLPPPISIFGHADPVGDDAYNKQLSGRRATAIYALLIRDTALWEELYSKPLGGDNWAPRALRTMLVTVDPSLETDSARLQRETGKAQSNAGTRKALFASYMDKLGGGVKLQKDDFLGGTDKDGKADYQGCSEFNPVLLFSAQEDEEFKKAENKKKRNAENAQNRRVIALLFRPGSKVDPAKWPCPRAKEGTAGCIKRFWSDGESRRGTRLPGKRRRFEETEDTFACRFYHRISSTSPCEKLDALIDIQLLYEDKEPMAEADFEAVFDKVSVTGKTDKNGRATILRPDDAPPEFLLFLNAFPEKYADVPVEPVNTANPRVAQNDSASGGAGTGGPVDPQSSWPHSVASILIALLLLTGSPALAAPREAAPVAAVLTGPIYREGGVGSVELKLNVDPARPSGSVTYSGLGAFPLIDPKLAIVETSPAQVRYRLLYSTDACLHSVASARGQQPAAWDPCYHMEGTRRPVLRVDSEVLLIRNLVRPHELFVAVGIPNIRSLGEVFRATGAILK